MLPVRIPVVNGNISVIILFINLLMLCELKYC